MSSANNLQELFGSFRAEWLLDERRLYELFSEPAYFPTLTDKRSCALQGGRGSGKTTALRCMSYEGQYALAGDSIDAIKKASFVGLYHRVSTPQVTAFQGGDQRPEDWRRAFAHYINLTVCGEILQFVDWYAKKETVSASLSVEACQRCSRALGMKDEAKTQSELLERVLDALQDLEIFVNNLDGPPPKYSVLKSPIDVLVTELRRLQDYSEKSFYIIFDEYENFLDDQQAVVNTIIKHSGRGYVVKIGVRELGWRIKGTLAEHEHLISPADYELINIEERLEGSFTEFARSVCETRLSNWYQKYDTQHLPLSELLPGLRTKDEAKLLGVTDRIASFDRHLQETGNETVFQLNELEKYVFLALNDNDFDLACADLKKYANGDNAQKNKYHNYHYALLFTIANKNDDITKYYSGNDVLSLISKTNIRFYLQLIAQCIAFHLEKGSALMEPIGFDVQTRAARAVGLRYLTELEGMTRQGSQLVKLLLGFGRLFQLMAANPIGAKPECNQFQVARRASYSDELFLEASQLLNHAVMNLALVRAPGTKLATPSDIREWEYALHPIFAAYFNFSHRRKRKMDISDPDLLGMVDRPQDTIRRLLRNRPELLSQEMPVQLRLFEDYFSGA